MIVSAGRAGQPSQTELPPVSRPVRRPIRTNHASGYGRVFWFSYAANLCIMVAITLLFRYADFVTQLGGDEFDLGWIVGVGMVGSLAMRCAQGVGIDRYGPRRIWLGSLLLFLLSALAHPLLQTVHGPAIYLLRIAYATSIAGAFGASITCVARQMPVARMAEVLGMLGTSGFIAMAVGPTFGDWICGSTRAASPTIHRMFFVAAVLAACSLVCASIATARELAPKPRRRPHVFWVLNKYHPGGMLMMGIVAGIGVSLPPVFLPRFAAERAIEQLAVYFTVYSATAFIARVLTRGLFVRVGLRPMMFLGLAAVILSFVSYLAVYSQWHLALPGFFGGIGHALLFPSIVAGGSGAFPNRYRGLGTTVMLAMLDIGTLVGAPLAGAIVYYSKLAGLPAYSAMFLSFGAILAAAGIAYWQMSRSRSSRDVARR